MALPSLKSLQAWLRFRAAVREEIGYLIERHGVCAAEAGAMEANRPGLHPRRVKILKEAVRRLKR
jgi:hypothetical protein